MTAIPTGKKWNFIVVPLILIALNTAMFGDVLFFQEGRILSREGLDLFRGEMFGLDFEFREIKKGNFPLWNPYLYSGAPFFDGLSSNALYLPNYVHLLLPLPTAINVGIALHTFLIGFFTYLWTFRRRLHPLACLLSSGLIMFSGPYFMHIYPGHLANLCAMTWVPLFLLAIDGLLDRPSVGWCLLGIFAVTMQILASQPQYTYYTAVTGGLYIGLSLIKASRRYLVVAGLSAIGAGSLLIAAVQLIPGLLSAQEGIRSSGLSLQYASTFSFPPENFLTLLAPSFFGDMTTIPYWGRYYLWEMSLFIGVTGFFLSLYGMVYGPKQIRHYSGTMVFLLLLLALGVHTPLFNLLYHYLPGFDRFRGTSKFIFPATLFLVMLSGIGLDSLIKNKTLSRVFIIAPLITGSIFILIVPLFSNHPHWWSQLVQALGSSGETFLFPKFYADTGFIEDARRWASRALLTSGIICLILALFFLLRNYYDKVIYGLVFMALGEVVLFAFANKTTFDVRSVGVDEFKQFYGSHPGDYRVLNSYNPNMALSTGGKDLWGYGPAVPLRYAQFIAFSQGLNPDSTLQKIKITHNHPLFKMLRCRFIIQPGEKRFSIQEIAQPLPHLLLLQEWKTLPRREDIFREMAKPAFDPRRRLILESEPLPRPDQCNGAGSIAIEEASTDFLRIRGKLDRAALLLITDSYHASWRAKPLSGSGQQAYTVMPANYILMAIPLAAGEQHFILEYLPQSFRIGKWLSLFSLALYMIVLIGYWKKRTSSQR